MSKSMTDMWHIAKVLEKVAPDNWLSCEFTYNSIVWKDATKAVAESIINEEHELIVAAEIAQLYVRKRKLEYPSIEEVTVALAEKTEGDSTMWDDITAKRAAIKTKYPKPE